MSSSAGVPVGFSHSQNQHHQAPVAVNNNNSNEDGVSVRPMRLKVLYTFDDDCKINCLARWPHVLNIQTVAVDETNSIGVIELYTCLQAIIECSPELLPRPGRDFTVYAFDFSEYDHPLVGQGMLSKALAYSAPPHPQKLITGRVCKNILGLFASGTKETLEVKLRFLPVQTTTPTEHANPLQNTNQNQMIHPNFDQTEWNAFMQSNQNVPQMTNRTPTPVMPNNQRDGTSIEVVNQLLSPIVHPTQPQHPQRPQQQTMNNHSQQFAAPTPVAAPQAPLHPKEPTAPVSRPILPRKKRGRPPKKPQGGNTSGYEDGTDGDDGPGPKKRAKVTQADWNRKSSFGTGGSESLRVAASTAGSIRSFRPLTGSGNQNAGSNLQEIPRAPTPIPHIPQLANQPRPQSQSGLRQEPLAHTSPPQEQLSPYPQLEPSVGPEDQLRFSIESAGPSPERMMSPAFTPQDIASSPPVLRTGSPMGSSPPCPSSPSLPPMPRFDSGFMSGDIDDLFGDDESVRPVDQQDLEVAKSYTKRRVSRKVQAVVGGELQIEVETPGPMELLPTKVAIFEPHKSTRLANQQQVKSRRGSVASEDGQTLPPLRPVSRAGSRLPSQPLPNPAPAAATVSAPAPVPVPALAPVTQPPPTLHLPTPPISELPQPPAQQISAPSVPQPRRASKAMTRTASTGSLPLPNIAASDPVLPRAAFSRSQTWSEIPHPMTEAPEPQTTTALSQKDAKRASIRQKLESALAKGTMPPYCENCGAIETPTWRKAWSQEHQGAPGYHEYSEEPGKVTTITILARDAEGNPTSYLLIKKALASGEDNSQFKEFNLCNPCGIWMSKYKSQRPEEKWNSRNNQDGDDKKKRNRNRTSKAKKTVGAATSEAYFPQSEANYPQSAANHQQSEEPVTGLDRMSPIDIDAIQSGEPVVEQQLAPEPTHARRGSSARPAKKLNAMTSDAASAALRRALQSSPARWTQATAVVIDEEQDSIRRLLFPSPRKDGSPKVLGEVITNAVQVSVDFRNPKGGAGAGSVGMLDKENNLTIFDAEEDVELMRLFEEEFARPTTPVQKTPVANPFKTPTRPTPSHRPITRSVTRSGRSVKSPGRNLLAPPKTPSRTPGSTSRRRSPRGNVFESPFTAQLNQLMSEAGAPLHSPSRHLDFSSLPDLPNFDNDAYNLQHYDEDFFSTDIPMPSSPPRSFHTFNNTSTGGNIDWDNFGLAPNPKEDEKDGSVEVKKETTGEEAVDEETV